MLLNRYLCAVVGESADRLAKVQPQTRNRILTLGLAIHVPVILWAVTAFVTAHLLFSHGLEESLAIAAFAAGLIYLIERIVISTPSTWWVNSARFVMGVLIALLGATSFDLVIFAPEVAQQLRLEEKRRLEGGFERELQRLQADADSKYTLWQRSQEAANCEANGTCGSRSANTGPIYRELAAQARFNRSQFLKSQGAINELKKDHALALEVAEGEGTVMRAGLLSRVQALHGFAQENTAAGVAWLLFLILVTMFELIVVACKKAFGETADDLIEQAREQVVRHNAQAYMHALTTPTGEARALIQATY